MGKRRLVYVLWFQALLLCCSCTDKVDLSVAQGISQLSVDGSLYSNTEQQVIYLNRTTPVFDNGPFAMQQGAAVTVSDSNGHTFFFTETKPGVYTANLRLRQGMRYTLHIVTDGLSYTAQTLLPAYKEQYDTVAFSEGTDPRDPNPGYNINLLGRDPKGGGDNYRFRVFRNGREYRDTLLHTSNLILYNDYDPAADGLSFGPLLQQQLNGSNLYRYGDSVDLWIMNMDDDTYKFLSACSDELENTGFFASPPGNVPSNIIGGSDLATQAVGHFGAYNVIKFSTVVPVSVYY